MHKLLNDPLGMNSLRTWKVEVFIAPHARSDKVKSQEHQSYLYTVVTIVIILQHFEKALSIDKIVAKRSTHMLVCQSMKLLWRLVNPRNPLIWRNKILELGDCLQPKIYTLSFSLSSFSEFPFRSNRIKAQASNPF